MVGIGPKQPPSRKGESTPITTGKGSWIAGWLDGWPGLRWREANDVGSMADLPQNLQAQIKEFEEIFTVDTAVLKKVVDHFVKELKKGVYPTSIARRWS